MFERKCPYYVVGVVTEDKRFKVKSWDKDEYTIDLEIDDFLEIHQKP